MSLRVHRQVGSLGKTLQPEQAKLNEAYESAYTFIDAQDSIPKDGREEWKRDLDKARYRWLTFRDAECDLIFYQWWCGSGAENAMTACQVQMTTERVHVILAFGKA